MADKLSELLDEMAGGPRWKLRRKMENGAPTFSAVIDDAEMDQVSVSFDGDGFAEIDTEDVSYLIFSPCDLRRLANLAEKAAEKWEDWRETKAGQKWARRLD